MVIFWIDKILSSLERQPSIGHMEGPTVLLENTNNGSDECSDTVFSLLQYFQEP